MTKTKDKRLRVILLDPHPTKSEAEWPFACVVSLADGESLYRTTVPCLHVFCWPDNKFDFADGLLAIEKTCTAIGAPVNWPELSMALSMDVKAYSKSLMPKQGDLGFERVMLWQLCNLEMMNDDSSDRTGAPLDPILPILDACDVEVLDLDCGYVTCPGVESHTTLNSKHDCIVYNMGWRCRQITAACCSYPTTMRAAGSCHWPRRSGRQALRLT